MIYAGLITDTNNFTVGNITPTTYFVAGECVKHCDPAAIYRQFMNNHTLKNLQLLALAINNISSHMNDRIILTHISSSEACRYSAQEEDYLGIVNRIAAISNCNLACFIYPKGNKQYVSLRSRGGYSISELAQRYGGGGHDGAAAFESDLSVNEIKDTVLEEFTHILTTAGKTQKFKF